MEIQLLGYQNAVSTSVNALLANLPELLEAFSRDERRLIVLVNVDVHRYVQMLSDSDATLLVEVVSNQFLPGGVALSLADEQLIRGCGFSAPIATGNPNWHFVATTAPERLAASVALARVLREVWHVRPGDIVSVTTWEGSQAA